MKQSKFFHIVVLSVAIGLCSCGSGSGGPTNPGPGKELNSPSLGPGATYQHTFASVGTFRYHCSFHSAMTGQVVVDASDVDTLVNVSIVSSSSPFPAASVKPGGKVVWKNNTGMVHTVTSN